MMEKIPKNKPENSREKEKGVLAYITFSRHGETKYTNQYPDITDLAVVSAQEKGVAVTAKKGAPDTIIHSPAVRAKGTADAIHNGSITQHGHKPVRMHESSHIGPSRFPDREKAQELFASIGDQEEIARQHHIEGGALTDTSVIETAESKRIRLYRGLEYLIRSLDAEEATEAPHIVIVSHYELVSLLLTDVFGDLKETFGRYNIPAFGEHVDVTLFRTNDSNVVTVEVSCDDKTARRDFDREKRLFI